MTTSMVVSQSKALAAKLDIEYNDELVGVLKATAFKGQVSDAQMTALLIVSAQYGLNPWTKEIYAFPDKQNGIVPVIGVDGWARIINEHPQFDGMDFEQDDESCTCIIFRKDRTRPTRVTEYMSECKREGFGPWKTHPKRMLRHKAMIQCSRLSFGFTGVYDEDEAERIKEAGSGDSQGNPIAQPAGPQRTSAKKSEPAKQAEVVDINTGEVTSGKYDDAEDATIVSEEKVVVIANDAWIATLRARMKANNKTEVDTLAHFELGKLEGITQDKAMEIAGWITGK